MKNRMPLYLGLIIVLALFAFSIVSCKRQSSPAAAINTPITIGIATWPGFAAGMIGKEKGFFGGIDLQYRTIDDLSARDTAFRSGQVDILATSVDLWVQEFSQGLKGKIILVTDESYGGDGIVANPDIKTIADMRGKPVAFARATPSHYLLFKVLQKAGLTPDDIQQVKMDDPGLAGQAFLGGKVDVAVTWEPFLTQVSASTKGHVLATSRDFPDTIVDVLVASPKLLGQPEVLKRFIQGWLKSVDYVNAHPDEAAQIMAKGLNVKTEDAQGMMAGLQFAGIAKNQSFFTATAPSQTPPLYNVIQDAAEFWKLQGIISNAPSPSDISSELLLKAATTAGKP